LIHWAPHLLAAIGLFTGAALLAPDPQRAPADLGRPLVAPLVLPFLWSGFAAAARGGSPEELVSRGRVLLRLLPRWVDGHLYLAQKLAFDASARARDTEAALDRLLAAVALLEDAARQCPDRSVEFLTAQAFCVEFRTRNDTALETAFRERVGRSPLETADDFLDRAETASSRLDVRTRRAYLAKRMVGLALRDGQRDRALDTLEQADRLLHEVEDAHRDAGRIAVADNAGAHRAALGRLRQYLHGDSKVSIAVLKADPYLEDIAGSLPRD